MPREDYCLSTRSIAELALVVCQSAERVLLDRTGPTSSNLRLFWQSSRSLQKQWTSALDEADMSNPLDVDYLRCLASRVFVTEMLIRTFSTVLACLDRDHETEDLTAVTRNMANGMMQIRNRVLSEALLIPANGRDHVVEIDRMRRRCDRWTDLLIGQIAGEADEYQFAFDPVRAKDFACESVAVAGGGQACAISYLVSAGLRLEFLRHLPDDSLDEPEFAGLMRAILSSLPAAFDSREGALNSLLRLRIVARGHRYFS